MSRSKDSAKVTALCERIFGGSAHKTETVQMAETVDYKPYFSAQFSSSINRELSNSTNFISGRKGKI